MPFQKLVNFPKSSHFRFYCSELPMLSELVQDVTIPAMILPPADVPSRFVDQHQPGEKIIFNELDIGFMMDENYDAYAEVWSWMVRMAGVPGINIDEYERKVVYADAEVIVLDNKQKEVRRFVFHDSWPTTIGAMPFETTGSDTGVKCVLTLHFLALDIVPNTKNLTGLGDFVYNH